MWKDFPRISSKERNGQESSSESNSHTKVNSSSNNI
jgi:hypothetical protein